MRSCGQPNARNIMVWRLGSSETLRMLRRVRRGPWSQRFPSSSVPGTLATHLRRAIGPSTILGARQATRQSRTPVAWLAVTPTKGLAVATHRMALTISIVAQSCPSTMCPDLRGLLERCVTFSYFFLLFPFFSYFFILFHTFSLEITKINKKTLVRGGEGNGGREVGGGRPTSE